MCQCCAPIGKKLAILFTLSRLAFIILGIVAIVTESELGMEKSEQQGEEENSIFAGFLVVGVWSFFPYGQHFAVLKKKKKNAVILMMILVAVLVHAFQLNFAYLQVMEIMMIVI